MHIGAACCLQLPFHIHSQIRHLGHAEVLVTPAPTAEKQVVFPNGRRHRRVVLSASRHPIEHAHAVQRINLAANVLRHENRCEEGHQSENQQAPDSDDNTARLLHPRQRIPQCMEEIDECRRRRQNDRRTGKRVQRREVKDHGRDKQVMATQELFAAARRQRRPFGGAGPFLGLHGLLSVMPPQGDRNAKEKRKIITSHVRIAKDGEVAPEFENGCPARRHVPERARRIHHRLQKPERRHGHAVPDDQLKRQALALMRQSEENNDGQQKRHRHFEDNVQVVDPIDAKRQERCFGRRIDTLRNQCSIATWTKTVVDKGNEQKNKKTERRPENR